MPLGTAGHLHKPFSDRAPGAAENNPGTGVIADGLFIFGYPVQKPHNISYGLRPFFPQKPGNKLVHLIISGCVSADKRYIEQPGGVNRTHVINRKNLSFYFPRAFFHERLGDFPKNSRSGKQIHLKAQYFIQSGVRSGAGMMGKHQVQPPRGTYPVSQQKLRHVDIYPHQNRTNTGTRISVQDGAVGKRTYLLFVPSGIGIDPVFKDQSIKTR
jgi:hypothetical protein